MSGNQFCTAKQGIFARILFLKQAGILPFREHFLVSGKLLAWDAFCWQKGIESQDPKTLREAARKRNERLMPCFANVDRWSLGFGFDGCSSSW